MSDEPILLSQTIDGIRVLTLNRPNQLNALSRALVAAIVAGVDAAHADRAVTGIVINANGRAFSAGADIKEAATHKDDDAESVREHARSARGIYRLGERTDKPLIAAVHGYVLGGGCNLAIATDMVVAARNAVFGYPEVKRGLAATMVTPGLVHRIGPKAAFELLMLAENIDAERALALGLINRVVADDQVLEEALLIARALAVFDQHAIRTTKRVFLKSTQLGLADSLEVAEEAMLLSRAQES
ncbi:MAG: enoyl-CoA hydratase/isomerase family protein [Gammaproteobacteria bacterium]|nr:enoyl-CoA hydratase/isomerase family protein [Gammaproteobacteria bacterium]